MKKFTSTALILMTFASVSCAPYAVSDFLSAARSGDVEKLRAHLSTHADPNERGGVNNWTALMHAIHKNQAGAVHTLLEGGANPNPRAGKNVTPLIMAAGYGYVDIVQDLLAYGADPKLKDQDGFTALDAAVSGTLDIDRFTVGKCQGATVRVILDKAPGLRLQDGTAARIAKIAGCTEMLGMLAVQ